MAPQPTEKNWREKITLAAIAGLIAGIARAITAEILEHLTSI
ncbi:hypothetical protein [Actinoplanes sp. NPDC051411]